MMLCDAHAHLGNDTEWEERTGKGILSLICATGPEEAGKLFSRLEWLKGRAVVPTAGLHPWYADQYTVQDMEPYIRRCPLSVRPRGTGTGFMDRESCAGRSMDGSWERREREMMLCDAHAHLGNDTEWEERTGKGILSLICATGPEEAGKLFSRLEWLKGRAVVPTAGLHPWYADQYTVQDMEPYIRRCPVVGEIGMDSVWCQVPLPVQEQVFREQLAMACSLKKPVILHTKGQEKAIASILREYPNRYLVHWYSCEEYLEEYLALDCYFSVGPDVWWNPAVAQAAKRVPRDRILVETDGLGAVQWAYENGPEDGKRTAPGTVSEALENTVRTMAEIRAVSLKAMEELVFDNLVRGFLGELYCL